MDRKDILIGELDSKVRAKQDKINQMMHASEYLMKTYEEMIILTDNWNNNVQPYVENDSKLMARKDAEIRKLNEMLKVAKRNFHATLRGERIPDVSGDSGEGRQ